MSLQCTRTVQYTSATRYPHTTHCGDLLVLGGGEGPAGHDIVHLRALSGVVGVAHHYALALD